MEMKLDQQFLTESMNSLSLMTEKRVDCGFTIRNMDFDSMTRNSKTVAPKSISEFTELVDERLGKLYDYAYDVFQDLSKFEFDNFRKNITESVIDTANERFFNRITDITENLSNDDSMAFQMKYVNFSLDNIEEDERYNCNNYLYGKSIETVTTLFKDVLSLFRKHKTEYEEALLASSKGCDCDDGKCDCGHHHHHDEHIEPHQEEKILDNNINPLSFNPASMPTPIVNNYIPNVANMIHPLQTSGNTIDVELDIIPGKSVLENSPIPYPDNYVSQNNFDNAQNIGETKINDETTVITKEPTSMVSFDPVVPKYTNASIKRHFIIDDIVNIPEKSDQDAFKIALKGLGDQFDELEKVAKMDKPIVMGFQTFINIQNFMLVRMTDDNHFYTSNEADEYILVMVADGNVTMAFPKKLEEIANSILLKQK